MRTPGLLLMLLSFALISSAQEQTASVVNGRAKTAFIEAGGNGALLSANYDFRFSRKQSGLGARFGVGFFTSVVAGGLTVPLGLNYLAGRGPHYFDGGLGVTIVTFGSGGILGEVAEGETGAILVPSAGYRYQPLGRGFTGRVFVSPFIGSGGVFFWGGVSGGIKF